MTQWNLQLIQNKPSQCNLQLIRSGPSQCNLLLIWSRHFQWELPLIRSKPAWSPTLEVNPKSANANQSMLCLCISIYLRYANVLSLMGSDDNTIICRYTIAYAYIYTKPYWNILCTILTHTGAEQWWKTIVKTMIFMIMNTIMIRSWIFMTLFSTYINSLIILL